MVVSTIRKHHQSVAIRKILSMLDEMDSSSSSSNGLVLNHVAFLLEDFEDSHQQTEQLLCSLITLILGAFSTHLDSESTLYTQIKLLQFRLMSPVTNSELVALQYYVESCADQITQMPDIVEEEISETLQPLLDSFGLDHRKPFHQIASKVTNKEKSKNKKEGDLDYLDSYWEVDVSEFGKSLQHLFSSNYLLNSISQTEKFAALLEVKLATLKMIDDELTFEERKSGVIDELEKILRSYQQLTQYFQEMSSFVAALQKDSIRLNNELDRVTLLSLTDELTGLPNRRAFIQRLKDELSRGTRYGYKLSLALIDIDHFKPVNDRFGHAIGDTVLLTYVEKVLSLFRQHDMVARYGGEEFVVIFPNTDLSGALQALQNVKQFASNCTFALADDQIQLPTFSAGLVTHRHNETLDELMQRADKVLYKAKNTGRNKIEYDDELAEINS